MFCCGGAGQGAVHPFWAAAPSESFGFAVTGTATGTDAVQPIAILVLVASVGVALLVTGAQHIQEMSEEPRSGGEEAAA
jgi:hypothetical protein